MNDSAVAKSFDFESTGDFLLDVGGSINSSAKSTINAKNGGITLDGAISGQDLSLTAKNDVVVNQTISAHHLTIDAQNENIAAAITAQDVDLHPKGDLDLSAQGSFTLSGHLNVNAGASINLVGPVSAATDAILKANSTISTFDLSAGNKFSADATAVTLNGNISAKLMDFHGTLTLAAAGSLAAGDSIHADNASSMALDGMVSATKNIDLHAIGDVEIGNTLQAQSLTISSGTLTINGSISANSVNLQLTSGLNSGAANSLISAPNISITLPGPFVFNTIDTTMTRFESANLASLSINASSITFDSDIILSNPIGDLTASNGNINATGHQLIGFDKISLTNGSLFASALTANSLTLNQSGVVSVTGDLLATQSLSAPGSVTVGGVLSSKSITADSIVANALHADNVTAITSLAVISADIVPFSSSTLSINAPTFTVPAGFILDGQNGSLLAAPANAYNLTLTTGTLAIASGGGANLISNLSLNGGDADPLRIDAGGDGGILNITSSDSISVDNPISATTGQNSNSVMTGGKGGTVNLTATNTINLNNKIEVSSNDGNRRRSARGGNINIISKAKSGTAIAVSSSAQLLALLNSLAPGPGGSIKLTSAGGDININGGTIQADRGTIDVRNNGDSGIINLTNAVLNASTIKVGALGNNCTLTIGGGTISADSLIKLYAGGSSGTVNFVNDVTLSGSSAKIIAGDTVTIFNGKIVTINGLAPVDVFTNHANYTGWGGNSSTTGTFGGLGALTHPLPGAPKY